MKRWFFFIAVLLSRNSLAQVPDVKVIYKDATSQTGPARSQQLAVGQNEVAVLASSKVRQPQLFSFRGEPGRLIAKTATTAAFAGDHLYVAVPNEGVCVYDAAGKLIQTLGDGLDKVERLQATPDGSTLFAINSAQFSPALVVFRRDRVSGLLEKQAVFQGDDAALERSRFLIAQAERAGRLLGERIVIAKGAVRVPLFDMPRGICVAADSKTVYILCFSGAVLRFARKNESWIEGGSLVEHVVGQRDGVSMATCAVQGDFGLFVGGVRRFAWLTTDGAKLSAKQIWADDSEVPGHEWKVLPFIDDVTALAASENQRYLFLVSNPETSIHVAKIERDELKFIGTIAGPTPTSRLSDVAVSPDGTKLFAKSSDCQLIIYGLGKSYIE